jgi:hypothetical protein
LERIASISAAWDAVSPCEAKMEGICVSVGIGRHFSQAERRAILPPHAIHWTGMPDEPLLTFAAQDISLLEALGIVVSVGELEYTIRGREVSINDPKKLAP